MHAAVIDLDNFAFFQDPRLFADREYNTLIGGDEEGASISIQATHFEISEIVRDSSTNYLAIYRYKPAVDYVGTDSVEIKTSTGSDGASPPTHIEYITINFTILLEKFD